MRELDSRVEDVKEGLPYRRFNVSSCSAEPEEVSLGCPDDAGVLLHHHLALGDAGRAHVLAGAGEDVVAALGEDLRHVLEVQVFGGDDLGPGHGGVVHRVAVGVGHDESLAALEADRVLGGGGGAALGSGGGGGGSGVRGAFWLGGGGLLGLLAVIAVVAEGGELAVDGAAVADAVLIPLLLCHEGVDHFVDVSLVDTGIGK